MHEIILAGFKFGDFLQNHQFAKLKTSPKFPAIQYTIDLSAWFKSAPQVYNYPDNIPQPGSYTVTNGYNYSMLVYYNVV